MIIGNPNPDFTSSLNLRLYHQSGFDFSVLLYTVYGNDIFSTRKLESPSLQEGRWTGVNQNNDRPSHRADRQYFTDRKSVVKGKSVSVRVDMGGRWLIKKKKRKNLLNR